MLRNATNGTARHWALEFNAVGAQGAGGALGVVGDPPPGVAGRNVPPPLTPVPAKLEVLAFLASFARSLLLHTQSITIISQRL